MNYIGTSQCSKHAFQFLDDCVGEGCNLGLVYESENGTGVHEANVNLSGLVFTYKNVARQDLYLRIDDRLTCSLQR